MTRFAISARSTHGRAAALALVFPSTTSATAERPPKWRQVPTLWPNRDRDGIVTQPESRRNLPPAERSIWIRHEQDVVNRSRSRRGSRRPLAVRRAGRACPRRCGRPSNGHSQAVLSLFFVAGHFQNDLNALGFVDMVDRTSTGYTEARPISITGIRIGIRSPL